MQIKINEGINQESWKKFVEGHPDGNIFQHPLMFNFITSLKECSALAVSYEEEGIIKGICSAIIYKSIMPFINTRAVIYGGPLCSENSLLSLEQLLKVIVSFLNKKVVYVEIRNFNEAKNNKDIFKKYGFQFNDHYNILVELDKTELLKKINKGKLRQIKRSLENNCEIIESVNEKEIFQFYLLLKELYKKKIKKPLPSWHFFKSFINRPELGKYFLIKYEERIIGGIMCPVYSDTIIYEWYIAGITNINGIYPGILATWSPIKFGLENNFKTFDFMGGGRPNEAYGVREYKIQFGGRLVNPGRYIKINFKFLYFLGNQYINIYKNVISKSEK